MSAVLLLHNAEKYVILTITNGITTKYVYGLGLIGEEKECCFKTYHFDFRGSTVAITDECGNITDTFKYDTYGKMTEHVGNSFVILGYNGRDGVVTDRNGLLYMRARYYSPDMRRFINADIIAGEISDSPTLNRYAYANGNPVSNVDPFGLSVDRGKKYDRAAAIEYAEEWYGGISISSYVLDYLLSKRNSEFYSYTTNCANFVSQCLLNGGIEMNDDWHSYSEFNLDKHLWDPRSIVSHNYWYDWDVSDAWRLAQKQFEYFKDDENGFINGDVIEISNKRDIPSKIKEYDIQKGDLLYWSEGSEKAIHHATIISKVTKDDILYAGNSMSRFDASLKEALGKDNVFIIRINDIIYSK